MRFLTLTLAVIIFGLDWLSKAWAQRELMDAPPWTLISGFFRLRYVENQGIAFGWFHSSQMEWKSTLLSLAAFVALALVIYYVRTTPPGERRLFVAFGLLSGGIVGNFFDRVLNGYVVDFVELHWGEAFVWPTFNVADAAITCGVGLILFDNLFGSSAGREAEEKSSPLGTQDGSAAILLMGTMLAFSASSGFLQAQTSQAAPATPTASAERIVEALEAKYKEITSLSADFRQIVTDRGVPQEEDGILIMKKPGRMLWEYQNPSRKYFVTDGKKSRFWAVDRKQVIVSDLNLNDLGEADSALLFLFGRSDISRQFRIEFERNEHPIRSDHHLLRLTPFKPRSDIDFLLMEVDPESTLIPRLVVVDPIGNRIDYVLSDFKLNIPIPDKRFRLSIPKDVEVIRQR